MSKQNRRVWVVDDSPLDAERARSALAVDHRVETFPDGAAALERVAHGDLPDVLVLDWVMPGVTGPEVCRFLRGSLAGARIGILLLTARRDTAEIVEGLEAGANDFLAKPWTDAELQARVAALVRTRELIERVERAEARTQRVLETAPDPILAVDAEGRVSFANAEAARVLGRAAPDLSGRRVSELLPGLAIDLAGAAPQTATLPDVNLDSRIFAPTARLVGEEGPTRVVVSLRDVTERRLADARRADFLSIVAHDLRSPLGAIVLRTELLARGRHGPLPEGALPHVEKIDKGLKSLVALINDFLDFTRLESGGYKIERGAVDLVAVVEEVMAEFRPVLDASGLEWRKAIDGPAVVQGDRRRVGQVLSNLVGNAIKFTPRGGSIRTQIQVEDGFVEVAVEDTGRGIEPAVLPRLFERYARARATEHEVEGTGLGLMIVKEIVEAHGGAVGATSRPGAGSRFWFRLPAPHRTPARGGP